MFFLKEQTIVIISELRKSSSCRDILIEIYYFGLYMKHIVNRKSLLTETVIIPPWKCLFWHVTSDSASSDALPSSTNSQLDIRGDSLYCQVKLRFRLGFV